MGLSELRELRQLHEENSKLKRLVADLSFDRQILQEIVQKKAVKPRQRRALGLWTQTVFALSRRRAAGLMNITCKILVYLSPRPPQNALRMRLRETGEPGALRLPAADGDPPERGWARESQAHLSALHRGWSHGAHQTAQEAGAALTRTDAQGDATQSQGYGDDSDKLGFAFYSLMLCPHFSAKQTLLVSWRPAYGLSGPLSLPMPSSATTRTPSGMSSVDFTLSSKKPSIGAVS